MEINKENTIFIDENHKSAIAVGFSKKDFRNHTGTSGLKYYLVVMYLRKHVQTFGYVTLTLDMLLEECGYSTKTHNKTIYQDFRNIFDRELIHGGYLECNIDIQTIKPTTVFTVKILKTDGLFYSTDQFVMLNVEEFDRICTLDAMGVNRATLVGLYLYIKQFLSTDPTPSVQRIAYPSKYKIKTGIGVQSDRTVDKAIDALCNEGILYVISGFCITDNEDEGKYVAARNVYAFEKEQTDRESVRIALEFFYKKQVLNIEEVKDKIKFLAKVRN